MPKEFSILCNPLAHSSSSFSDYFLRACVRVRECEFALECICHLPTAQLNARCCRRERWNGIQWSCLCMRASRCLPDPQDATCRWIPSDPEDNNGQSQAGSAARQEAQKHTRAARNCFSIFSASAWLSPLTARLQWDNLQQSGDGRRETGGSGGS